MPTTTPTPDITLTFTTAASPEHAWRVFTEQIGAWWPPEYTWSGDALVAMQIDPREGGLCTELGPHGFRCDWGRIITWEPPSRLTLLWHISPRREPVPNPDHASEITVQFEATPDGNTEMTFTHSDFDRHGDEGAAYREAMASPQGWPWMLERYLQAAYEATTPPRDSR